MSQSVVLAGKLIALFDEPPVLGPLGIAVGPCRQHQGAQRSNVVGKGVGRRQPGIILCRQRRAILNFKVSQHRAGL
jgi:hypothetical protein